MSVLIGTGWIDAPKGAFVVVPGGTTCTISRTVLPLALAC